MSRSIPRMRRVVAQLLGIVVLAGACNSPEATSSTSPAQAGDAAANTSATQEGQAAADSSGGGDFADQVDAFLSSLAAPQTEGLPEEGPAAVPDKDIALVTVTLAEEGALRNIAGIERAAELLGWNLTTFDAQGVPSTANEQILQAITTQPDGIVLVGLDFGLVAGGVEEAVAAGIPVACSTCWDSSADDTRGLYSSVAPPLSQFENMGYAAAAYAYQHSGGAPRFLMMNDASLSNLSAREAGYDRFLAECQAAGEPCTEVGRRPFVLAELTTEVPAQAAALAQANPDWNAFWVSFDFAGLQVLNGLQQAGLADDPDRFMVSANGDGANLEIIGEGGFQKMTVGVSFEWAGMASMDNLNRIFAGEDPIEQFVPIRLFDQDNYTEAEGGDWDGDVDYEAAYAEIWEG